MAVFFSGSRGHEKLLSRPLNQILATVVPHLAHQICRWERHLWDHWDPFYNRRVRGREESRFRS